MFCVSSSLSLSVFACITDCVCLQVSKDENMTGCGKINGQRIEPYSELGNDNLAYAL